MNAEIISIGDEILIGQINNTNSVWMAQELTLLGIRVTHMSTIADSEAAIVEAFDAAQQRSQLVLITGGLGPTKDDVTKKTFANYFSVPLVMNDQVLEMVSSFFTKRNRELSEVNRQQALVPEGSTVILNQQGTAPGMWMKKKNCIYISMPGVPHEMKAMMRDSILPRIRSEFELPAIYHRTILTAGIGESMLAEKIQDWEDQLLQKGMKLAYLPQPGMVRLRISAFGQKESLLAEAVEEQVIALKNLVPQYIFAEEQFNGEAVSLQSVVVNLLKTRGESLSIAESCTGGTLASLITSIPGASEVFKGGLVPYTNEAKQEWLGLSPSIFSEHGTVSKECVVALATEVRRKFKSDYGIGISGIAGPGGGSAEKPVGMVWIAVADQNRVVPMKFQYGDSRQINITMSAMSALNLLRKLILKQIAD